MIPMHRRLARVVRVGPAPAPQDGPHLAAAAGVAGVWGATALFLAFAAGLLLKCPFASCFHAPCPGCGMTRALRLLCTGQLGASLRMHPLAAPALAVVAMGVAATVKTTFLLGSPTSFYQSRLGRGSLQGGTLVYVAAVVLWGLRWAGFLGGPVAVR